MHTMLQRLGGRGAALLKWLSSSAQPSFCIPRAGIIIPLQATRAAAPVQWQNCIMHHAYSMHLPSDGAHLEAGDLIAVDQRKADP